MAVTSWISNTGTSPNKSYMFLTIEYTSGNGSISISKITGYCSASWNISVYGISASKINISIGGQTTSITPGTATIGGSSLTYCIGFGANNTACEMAAEASASGLSGNTTVSVSFTDGSGTNSNISGAYFETTIDAGTSVVAPTVNTPEYHNVTDTTASVLFSVASDGGASIQSQGVELSLTNFGEVVKSLSGNPVTFSDLTPNTTYYARAYANNGTYTGYSGVVSFTTLYSAPTDVSISPEVISDTEINLHRTFANATICQYTVNDSGWIDEGTTTTTGVYCSGDTISGLSPDTDYTIQVRFRNNNSAWTYSNIITIKTDKSKLVYINVNGTFKEAKVYVNVNGAWKEAKAYINVNGTWKEGIK